MDPATLERHAEVMRGARMTAYANDGLSLFLAPSDPKLWMPSDLLPNVHDPEQMGEFLRQAKGLRANVLAVFIGDWATEDALPTYTGLLTRVPGLFDDDVHPWAKAIHWWSAEENRHGDVMKGYLGFHPDVRMRQAEVTVYHLGRNMFNPRTHHDPYRTFCYTTLQERATLESHANVAKLARADGDEWCARICAHVGRDENRHERFYAGAIEQILAEDPDDGVIAIYDMVKDGIRMPAERMYDGLDAELFRNYALVASGIGVLTPLDMLEHVTLYVRKWGIERLRVQSAQARQAQEQLATFASTQRVKAERATEFLKKQFARRSPRFSWIRESS